MMKIRFLSLFWVVAAVLSGGCQTGQGRAEQVPTFSEQAQIQGNEIIRAIADRDFPRYRKHGGDVSGIGADQEFVNSCDDMEKRLGKIRKVAFLTVLETPGVANLVYRIDFCRKSADGKNLNHQQLFQLVFGKVDGKSQLLGMRIM